MSVNAEQQDVAETPKEGSQASVDARRAEAGHKVLEMFAAVCGAPDAPAVAAEANQALAELQALLDTPERHRPPTI
jgi:hypothetical protein